MKSIVHLIFCLTLPLAAGAETPLERELAQLREQRDKAVAAASEPINRHYQTALEQTLRRAMQANDFDAAVKVKAALAELGVAAPAEPQKSPLQLLMDGSRWEWFNGPEPKGKGNNWVEFYKDGAGQSGWNQSLRYTVTGPTTLKVSQGEGGTSWFFVVDPVKKLARYDPAAGAGHEQRSMSFEKRISSTNPNK